MIELNLDISALSSIMEIKTEEANPVNNINIFQVKDITMFLKADKFQKFPYQIIHIISRVADYLYLISQFLSTITRGEYLLKRSPDQSKRRLDLVNDV